MTLIAVVQCTAYDAIRCHTWNWLWQIKWTALQSLSRRLTKTAAFDGWTWAIHAQTTLNTHKTVNDIFSFDSIKPILDLARSFCIIFLLASCLIAWISFYVSLWPKCNKSKWFSSFALLHVCVVLLLLVEKIFTHVVLLSPFIIRQFFFHSAWGNVVWQHVDSKKEVASNSRYFFSFVFLYWNLEKGKE